MRNKRLAVILIIFSLLTLLVVLGSTAFTVSKVEINWRTSNVKLSLADNDLYLQRGNFNYGESIFLVNKNSYIQKLEQGTPYLKVIGIETVFPNKLVVHVAERTALFALKVTDSQNPSEFKFMLLDDELKVLEKTNQNIANNINPINLDIQNISYTDTDFPLGSFVNLPAVKNILNNFSYSMQEFNYNYVQTKAFAKSMVLVPSGANYNLTIETNWGIHIEILKAEIRLSDKLNKAVSLFNQLQNGNPPINTGTITAFEHNGVIYVDHE